ncbi:MAG: zinc-dependent alcohol dehydrogenase family protein [Polyangiales bacterium]
MKSARIETFTTRAEDIELREVEPPQPARGQVLVRMHMAPVNPSDFNYVEGTYQSAFSRLIWNHGADRPAAQLGNPPFAWPPYALGVEGVGTVMSAGGGLLARRLVGKRVAVVGGPPNGTWQEMALIDAQRAFPVSRRLSDEQACAFFVNPLTALILVRQLLRVPRGAVLLQTAAGSALCGMVRNLARADGFRVIDVVRSQAGAERLRSAGSTDVIALESENLVAAVHRLCPGGVSFVLDAVAGPTGSEAARCLAPGGRMVCYGTLSGEPLSIPPRDLMMPMTRIEGFYLPVYLESKSLWRRLSLVRANAKLIAEGILDTPVARVYPLDSLHEALAHARRPGRAGKVLLDMRS